MVNGFAVSRAAESAEPADRGQPAGAAPLLEVIGLHAGYGGLAVVRDLSLVVNPGEVVALIGSNGAGKTTTLLTLSGDLAPISGEVVFLGSSAREALHRRASRGLSFVTEERSVFMRLTVAENLRLASCTVDEACQLFPELRRLESRKAGLLSGGEQQMLTLARALARKPKLLLVDELSLGLAPLIVQRLLHALRRAADEDGVGVLMVEQQVRQALNIADRAYVMRRGQVQLSGPCSELRGQLAKIEESYLSADESSLAEG